MNNVVMCRQVLMKILASIRAYEGSIFLPEAIKNLLEAMLQLFSKMNKLASERFVKSHTYSGLEPPNEYFPSLPLHSARMNFKADYAKSDQREQMMMTATKITQKLLK